MNQTAADRNPVEQVADEFLQRIRRGERPSLTEYTEKFPELADEIRELFPALVMIERLGPQEADRAGPTGGKLTADGKPIQQLGEYRILREIGRGGMGVVYEAEQESLGRHVALKVLPFHSLMDSNHLERFRREARAAAGLHHTNIVPVFGVGEQAGVHYYAMQFIHGQGLDEVLQEVQRLRQSRATPDQELAGPGTVEHVHRIVAVSRVAELLLTGSSAMDDAATKTVSAAANAPCPVVVPTQIGDGSTVTGLGQAHASTIPKTTRPYFHSVAQLGLQVAEALAYAHGQGIVHRDIKPSNLLLDTKGTVWVTDFGLAKTEGTADLTHTGDIVGTLRYMAPERLNGWSDPRSDLYSLGLTLYEMLTLRPALDESERGRLIKQITHEDPPRPRKIDRQIPRDLETIVLKASAKEPGQRYTSAAAMADDLRQFLADKPIAARRASMPERAWRWCRRNPGVALLTGALAAAFLIGFAAVFWQWRRAEDRGTKLLLAGQATEAQRQRAQQHFDTALAVVDRMLLRVGDKELADVPYMDEHRRRLLEDALEFYRGFRDEEGSAPAVRREVALAYAKTAHIYELLERRDDAEQACSHALKIQKALSDEFRDVPAYRQDLSKSYGELGTLYLETARMPDAEVAFLKSLELNAQLVRDHSDDIDYQRGLRKSHADLGRLYHLTSRRIESEDAWKTALSISQSHVDHDPTNPDDQNNLASCHEYLGVLYRESSRLPDAEKAYLKVVAITEQLARDFPRDSTYQESLAASYNQLGNLYRTLERPADAKTMLQQSLEASRRLAQDHPDVPKYQMQLAVKSNNLGLLYRSTGDGEKAVAAFRDAIDSHRKLSERYPQRTQFVMNYATSCTNLAKALGDVGKSSEALDLNGRAIDILESLHAADPRNNQTRDGLWKTLFGRASTLQRDPNSSAEAAADWRRVVELTQGVTHEDDRVYRPRALAYLGQHVQAAAEVEAVLTPGEKRGWVFEESARAFAICSTAVLNDSQLPADDRNRLAEQYSVRTVQLLTEAESVGFFKTASRMQSLKNSQNFAPLQSRQDFQRLLNQIEERAKGPAN